MLHYTLNTGHIADQPDAGPPGLYDLMAPLLKGGSVGKVVPALSAFRIKVMRAQGAAIFSVWKGRAPLVTCGLALKIDTSGPVWTELERLYLMVSDKNPLAMAATHAAAQPESTPWLGVILLPSLSIQTKETIRWLGDLEMCMAWSIVADEVIKNR